MNTKHCPRCDEALDLAAFHASAQQRSGSWCKSYISRRDGGGGEQLAMVG